MFELFSCDFNKLYSICFVLLLISFILICYILLVYFFDYKVFICLCYMRAVCGGFCGCSLCFNYIIYVFYFLYLLSCAMILSIVSINKNPNILYFFITILFVSTLLLLLYVLFYVLFNKITCSYILYIFRCLCNYIMYTTNGMMNYRIFLIYIINVLSIIYSNG